ncbi:hypothetical protein BDN72DRAFT_928055 [Pluteus cervinus]|uniref:Uncharacterized protein n=1 Tax=Pluteus cervinus TaxID=181527 RepID=A0ACD3B4L8_9AGAR|nr:hypothetical protein BDN72DRAFT_928055 [Pluteus cervinus]
MASENVSETLTNNARPKTSATLTVRIIKSFEFRTERSLVLHAINLETTTVLNLKDRARQAVQTQPGWKPYRNTSNLIINLDNDDWLLSDDDKTLADIGFENETEVSFFNYDAYQSFRENPTTSWD